MPRSKTRSQPRLLSDESALDARDRILLRAEELFASHGFASTSTKSIAEAAAVPAGLIFYHFSSKEDLLNAVLERNHLPTVMEALFRRPTEDSDPEAMLQAALENLLSWVEEHRAWARLFFQELTSDRDGADRVRGQRKVALKHLASWLERHLTSEGRHFKEAALAAHLLGGSLMVAALVDRPAHKKAYVQSLLRLLLRGGF